MKAKRKWTPEEIEKLKELKREGKSRWQIAKELGRPIGSVIAKLDTHEGQIIPVGVIRQLMVPSTVVEERDRATQAGHRDYTAEFCGDPLIGRSALDGYNGTDDFAKSLEVGYAAIRQRVAAGGKGWEPSK